MELDCSRRVWFAFHLLIWLVVRLAVGTLPQMPPDALYDAISLWFMLVSGHGILLAIFDGREGIPPPLPELELPIQPERRRWLLLLGDAGLWMLFMMTVLRGSAFLGGGSIFVGMIWLVWGVELCGCT